MHKENSFITLTYAPEHLPPNGSLNFKHFQDFMKRLRKANGAGIRFFHCGEYGEKYGRPHYHACLFNFDFKDKKLETEHRGNKYYVSQQLNELWPFGRSIIGDVTFQSAAYVARYITKKVTGEKALERYTIFDKETGEWFADLKPEYTTMSRRPGIGKLWLDKFTGDVYPDDFVVMNEKKMKPPKYYDAQFEIAYPEDFENIKRKRKKRAKTMEHNNSGERLIVREEIQKRKFERLKRSYENDV